MSEAIRTQLLELYAEEHRDHIGALRATLAKDPPGDLDEAYRHAHSLKGAARAVDLEVVTRIAHQLEELIESWWGGQVAPDAGQRRLAGRALDAIEDLSALALAGRPQPVTHPVLAELEHGAGGPEGGQPAPAVKSAAPPQAEVAGPATLRVGADALERLDASISALSLEIARMTTIGFGLRPLPERLDREMAVADALRLRPFLTQLRAAIAETLHDLAERDWALGNSVQALKEDWRRLRMVSAEGVLGNFGPMVREMAAQMGKEVRLETAGLETLADRDVVHALAEAVMHLLRNALVHGIETPDERAAQGKSREGVLSIAVSVSGARLEVTVADDGRGIDTEAVRRAAIARGLVAEDLAQDVGALIFLPGLSTAAAVDTGAGRGMGMSIAQAVAARLQGTLEVDSRPGRGARFTLSVPVSALAQRLLIMEARGQAFAIQAAALCGVHAVAATELVVMEGRTFAVLDGRLTPLADLGALMGLAAETHMPTSVCTAVINLGPMRLGLVADRLLNVKELPLSALEPELSSDDRIVGTVMVEGKGLVLVLSPAALLRQAAVRSPAPPAPPDPPGRPRTILVVDDSPTARVFTGGLVETQGYGVVLAEDGRDALDKMASAVPHAVISDIEMPRLDGFGLVAAMRRDPRLRQVPVVLVSSRDTPADRARASALGVRAYLNKVRFDQAEFLTLIRGLA